MPFMLGSAAFTSAPSRGSSHGAGSSSLDAFSPKRNSFKSVGDSVETNDPVYPRGDRYTPPLYDEPGALPLGRRVMFASAQSDSRLPTRLSLCAELKRSEE